MKVIRGMLGSKKWTAAIAMIVGLVAQDVLGLDLDVETQAAIVTIVIGIIAAQGAKDHALAKKDGFEDLLNPTAAEKAAATKRKKAAAK